MGRDKVEEEREKKQSHVLVIFASYVCLFLFCLFVCFLKQGLSV